MNESLSNICEPTWLWNPATSILRQLRASRTKSSACPVSIGTPNWESTLPVLIASSVCGSRPTVSLSSTRCVLPSFPAMRSSDLSSLKLSTTKYPIPEPTPYSMSASVLLVPWKNIFSAGNPADRAVYISPGETTSTYMPSERTTG